MNLSALKNKFLRKNYEFHHWCTDNRCFIKKCTCALKACILPNYHCMRNLNRKNGLEEYLIMNVG